MTGEIKYDRLWHFHFLNQAARKMASSSNSRLTVNDKADKIRLRVLSHLSLVTLSWRVVVREHRRTEARGRPSLQSTLSAGARGPAVSCFSSLPAPSQSQSSYSAPGLTDLSPLEYPRSRPGPLLGNAI